MATVLALIHHMGWTLKQPLRKAGYLGAAAVIAWQGELLQWQGDSTPLGLCTP